MKKVYYSLTHTSFFGTTKEELLQNISLCENGEIAIMELNLDGCNLTNGGFSVNLDYGFEKITVFIKRGESIIEIDPAFEDGYFSFIEDYAEEVLTEDGKDFFEEMINAENEGWELWYWGCNNEAIFNDKNFKKELKERGLCS